jgi:hypothetical protein
MNGWLSSVAETSGYPTGGITLSSVDAFASIGEAIVKAVPIFGRGLRLIKKDKTGYCLAIGVMQNRFGPSALEQFRRLAGLHTLGFDIGASIHAGQVVATPPENLLDPSALAGFFLAHGIVDGPGCIEALKIAVREPEYRIGVAVAVRSINDSRKGRIQKMIESVLNV